MMKIDWNKFLQQCIDNWGIILVGILILFILVIIAFVIYNKFFKILNDDNLKIRTGDIDGKGDIIIGKGNIKK